MKDSGSSFDSPIRAPAPIILLWMVHDNDSLLVNDISFVLTKKDVDHLYNHYQISRELFQVHTLNSRIRLDDQIPAKDTIIVYKEKLEVNLQFSINLFFVEVFRFNKLAAAQLHPNI